VHARPIRTSSSDEGAGVVARDRGTIEAMLQEFVAVPARESTTRIVKGVAARPATTPLTTPVEVFRVRPDGRVPVMENV
jgi:hypothetical protein